MSGAKHSDDTSTEATGRALMLGRAAPLVLADAYLLERTKLDDLLGLAAGTGLSIVALFLFNKISVVNPALFGIVMISAATMGLLAARRRRSKQRMRLLMLQERYQTRLQAIEHAITAVQLSEERVQNELREAQQEYEAARQRLLGERE